MALTDPFPAPYAGGTPPLDALEPRGRHLDLPG